MYKRFAFEGDVHQTLVCVPLTVRRKLDLAALKISLEGWQALPHAERLALCHLPVDAPDDLAVYVEVMKGFCSRAGVPLKPLVDPDAAGRVWNSAELPERVRDRAAALHASLDGPSWSRLDEESRYALVKLSDPKRNPLKIHAALVELGLLAGPAPRVQPEVAVCVVPPP